MAGVREKDLYEWVGSGLIGFQKMSLISIMERKAISATPCMEREKRIQEGVTGETLGEMSTREAGREMRWE